MKSTIKKRFKQIIPVKQNQATGTGEKKLLCGKVSREHWPPSEGKRMRSGKSAGVCLFFIFCLNLFTQTLGAYYMESHSINFLLNHNMHAISADLSTLTFFKSISSALCFAQLTPPFVVLTLSACSLVWASSSTCQFTAARPMFWLWRSKRTGPKTVSSSKRPQGDR